MNVWSTGGGEGVRAGVYGSGECPSMLRDEAGYENYELRSCISNSKLVSGT